MAITNKRISWNWAAFIFGGFWLLYRKMYYYFMIVSLLSLFIALPKIGFLVVLLLPLFLGMFGNYLYAKTTYENLEEIARTLLKKYDEEIDNHKFKEELIKEAGQKGGTSVIAVLIGSIIYFIVLGVVTTLLMEFKSYEIW
jgi:hypothetical protein